MRRTVGSDWQTTRRKLWLLKLKERGKALLLYIEVYIVDLIGELELWNC